MALPVAAILTLLDLAQNERVHKGLKGVWAKLPFGKDAKVAAKVEGRAQILSTELASLARTMGRGDLEPEMERRFARFEKEIVADGVPADEAPTVRADVEKTLRATAVEPILETLALQNRIEELETRIESLELRLRAADRTRALATTAASLAGSALALALGALLLLFLRR